MTKILKGLFAGRCARAFRVGGRGAAFLLVLAFVNLMPQSVEGYIKLDNDRILLMNNDAKSQAAVTYQSYYDTNTANKTYWVHTGTQLTSQRNLLAGTNHVMYAKDGTRLWELCHCRAGSATVISSTRNYIPWESSAKSILDGTTKDLPVNATGAMAVGTVILRNTDEACIYSPVYEDGIGTIYFDAVNSFTSANDIHLDLQIATNALNGVDFLSAANSDGNLEWRNISFTSLTVKGARSLTLQGTLEVLEDSATNLVLASTAGGSEFFYRVRARLNYYGPIRFRIRRTNSVGGSLDATALALVDNIIASYPPMSAALERYGHDGDSNLEGPSVLGCVGDFSSPILSRGQVSVYPRAWFRFILNSGSSTAAKIKNASFVYRWRYLNQVITPWKTIAFDQSEISSTEFVTSNLVGAVDVPLGNGVGDLEYYLVADVDAPFYSVQDFATSKVGYGAGWREAITAITNRANYVDETPACGHDYFVRIRESESPCEYVKLCTAVTTNGTTGTVKEDVRMELVGTNTWRYCYYVPTNAIGETLTFHFEGKKLFADPENPFKYASSTNVWKCDLMEIPYLPYTSVAGESFTRDAAIRLDGAGTHLIIEFNDELLSYSVSHGTYQNFNTWTDAMIGYRGNAKYDQEASTNGTESTGVADTKKKFVANMADWEVQGYTDPFWFEDFNTSDTVTFPLYTSFDTMPTPLNGWEAGHGQWIRGARGSAATAAAGEEVSLQMEGRGQGYVALDKESGMPKGIGTVSFAARVAQAPRFDDFAVYGDGTALRDYAVSAKISMSRIYEETLSPSDISPSQPSLSLIGYYREKKGCYEYRISRTASDQLTCALYKWEPVSGRGMTAHLLASNVITSVNNAAYAKPGPGQTAFYNFQNMLVPGSRNENVRAAWTAAYLYLFNKGDGSVYIECMLSNSRNNSTLNLESRANQKKVLVFTDSDAPFQKGSYGVGSTDCNASFGVIQYHLPADPGNYAAGINYAGTSTANDISSGDWAFYLDRWQQPRQPEEFGMGSLNAVMPSNQTVRLQFKDDVHGWFDSGYEQIITSFSTNRYEFTPCVSPNYKVRLITGGHTYDEVRTDVVVDDVEITAWRAADYPNLNSTGLNGQSQQWVYMAATLETSAEVKGPGTPSVGAAGTNGYAFSFTTPGQYTVIPQMDLVVDRMLLVGGGGAGGWTLGGGGGGGGVLDYDFGTNTVLLAKGSTNVVIVGGGGNNYFVNSNDGSNWKAGGNGGSSSITFTDANTGRSSTYTVKGGGGGAGWNQRAAVSGQATGGGAAQGDNNNYYSARATGTTGQGNSGGRAYGDRAGGGGGASLEANGMGADATAEKNGAGDGGAGRPSDITGTVVYYGGGGGGGGGDGNKVPNSDVGGTGGVGGGGTGLDRAAKSRLDNVNGVNGLGGGGGGGSHGGATGTSAGGTGGSGVVILRLRSSSKVCTLQPARGSTEFATGLRSPYLEDGLSMFSFNYANANSNCVLWLQVCTNNVIEGESSMSAQLTTAEPNDARWNTIATFAFTNVVAQELASGTRAHFMSLRAPYRGFMRLVVAPEVMQYCADNEGPDRDVSYGQITITGIHCYNEPALDMRSWWGWNLHTEGWNT
ncbi:MAG: glycine-rich domain-containing protein, partial [Kiritimatiellia bacterium]